MSEYSFPVESIELPSGGKFYPEGHPLRSGKIDVKYMTAKEEDILTSTNLIKKGTVLDKLMESLIVTKGVKPDDMLTGDLNAVMIAARILAYGKDYPVELLCTSCGEKFQHVIDLTALETIAAGDLSENGEHKVTLPTGVVVTFKLLTRGDERAIEAEVEAMKKFNNSVEGYSSARLKYMITSVNGNTDRKTVREFAENMIIRDVRALREAVRKVSPDVNFDMSVTCPSCETMVKGRMPFGVNFFWPDFGA
jgi:hypothetical protein